ncbi:MAG: hypothetical protein SNJ83_10675 [Aggregatilineales bacterium]
MDALRDLYSVVTLSEACRLWGLHRTTLVYCIDMGLLSARRSGRVWLLLSRELTARYGQPVALPSDECFLAYRTTGRQPSR